MRGGCRVGMGWRGVKSGGKVGQNKRGGLQQGAGLGRQKPAVCGRKHVDGGVEAGG